MVHLHSSAAGRHCAPIPEAPRGRRRALTALWLEDAAYLDPLMNAWANDVITSLVDAAQAAWRESRHILPRLARGLNAGNISASSARRSQS